MESDGCLGPDRSMERHETRQVKIREYVAVHHHEGVIDTEFLGSKTHRTSRIKRFRLNCIAKANPRTDAVRVGLEKTIGEVPKGKDSFINPVRRELAHDPLEHVQSHDGKHLLGSRAREGSEPRAFSSHEDDRLHPTYFEEVGVDRTVVGVPAAVVGTTGNVVGGAVVGVVDPDCDATSILSMID